MTSFTHSSLLKGCTANGVFVLLPDNSNSCNVTLQINVHVQKTCADFKMGQTLRVKTYSNCGVLSYFMLYRTYLGEQVEKKKI